MKIAVIVVRILFGLLLVMSAVVVLFNLAPQPELKGNVKTFMLGMEATGYMLTFIKVTELICGLALVSGFFAPLATVVIFPITINIVLFHALVAHEGYPVSLFVLFANLFLAFAYRRYYAPMLVAK